MSCVVRFLAEAGDLHVNVCRVWLSYREDREKIQMPEKCMVGMKGGKSFGWYKHVK